MGGAGLDVVVCELLVGDVGGGAGGHVAEGAVRLLGVMGGGEFGAGVAGETSGAEELDALGGAGVEWGSWQVVQVRRSPVARLQALRRRASYWLVARAAPDWFGAAPAWFGAAPAWWLARMK